MLTKKDLYDTWVKVKAEKILIWYHLHLNKKQMHINCSRIYKLNEHKSTKTAVSIK